MNSSESIIYIYIYIYTRMYTQGSAHVHTAFDDHDPLCRSKDRFLKNELCLHFLM